MEYLGKIISCSIAFICLLLVVIFFIRKKAPALVALSFSFFALYFATHIVSWFWVPDLKLAQDVMLLFCIGFTVASLNAYEYTFKTFFSKLAKMHHKSAKLKITDEELRNSLQSIVDACRSLSKSRTGALIVLANDDLGEHIVNSGTKLDAEISASLLESIFNTHCPMHDGAVIIKDNRIMAAGCFLPLNESTISSGTMDKTLGTRHRAGLSVTLAADGSSNDNIISIIVSEETGIISVARKGTFSRYLTPEKLFDLLYDPMRDVDKFSNR